MRSALISCMPSLKAASLFFFGKTGLQPPLILPGDIALFVERTHGILGASVSEVVEHCTVFPALEPFLSPEARDSIIAHFKGEGSIRSPYAYLGLATAAGAPKHAHLFCPICARKDIESYGGTYWHREHQLPFMTTCPHDKGPLTPGCGNCRYSEPAARHLGLPLVDKCWCGSELRPIRTLRTADARLPHLRYAMLASELLQGGLLGIGPSDIGAAYKFRAEQMGLVRNGRVDRQRFFEEFEKYHGFEFLSYHRSNHDQVKSWCCDALAKAVVPPSMARNVMLIDFLFGTVKALADTVNSLASIPADGGAGGCSQKTEDFGISSERLTSCQLKILKFRKLHPKYTRNQIINALGHTATLVRKHARKWYEHNMPASVRPRGRPPQYSVLLLRRQADDLMEYISAKHSAEMNSPQRPRKITERRLFFGHSLQARVKDVRAAVPKVSKLIDRLLEDTEAFKHREARWLLDHPERIPVNVDKISFISRVVGLSASTVARIAAGMRRRRRR